MNFQSEERAKKIFRHIYSCYSGWAPMLSDWQSEDLDLDRDVPRLNKLWRKIILESDLSSSLELSSGTTMTALDLIQHVMNHGTYHRGHLRGLAEAEALKEFPETDFVRFVGHF